MWMSGMQLHCTGQSPQTKNYSPQNIHITKTEKHKGFLNRITLHTLSFPTFSLRKLAPLLLLHFHSNLASIPQKTNFLTCMVPKVEKLASHCNKRTIWKFDLGAEKVNNSNERAKCAFTRQVVSISLLSTKLKEDNQIVSYRSWR